MENGESSYRRFLAGDDEGMVELIRNYKDGLILYLCSITGDIDSAEECVQDTFIRLAVKKPHFAGRSSFRTWLYAIGRNMAVDRLRSLKRRRQTSLEDAAEISDGTDLERSYLMSERKVTLHRAMRNLKKEYQQVLWLTYFEEFTAAEAASAMGKTRKQAENLLYNARKALRTELEKEGFSYDEL